MKLEMVSFPVSDIKFSRWTRYSNGVLEIDKDELTNLVLEDSKIASVDLDVAFPGEHTRIVNVRDAVEPRAKVSGPGCVFPGIMGPVETVGEGRTHRLPKVTVMASAEYQPTILSGFAAQSSGLIDMWGSGSLATPFASTMNIVLILTLKDTVTELEAHTAIQSAEFRVAHRLIETTRNKTSQDVEVFELFDVDPVLPRVVYILSCVCEAETVHSGVAFYGQSIRESLPTFVHPNEFLDGALTTDARRGMGTRIMTWRWMNQPLVIELLREHGKTLNFLGVILQRTEFATQLGKQVSAEHASQIARLLGADGALITRTTTSGNSFIEVMLTLQACERKGVKTVLMTAEYGGKDGVELPLVFYVPEATAMVSTSSFERVIKLPVPAKVIGVADGRMVRALGPQDKPFSPWSELTVEALHIASGIDWFGDLQYTCREY